MIFVSSVVAFNTYITELMIKSDLVLTFSAIDCCDQTHEGAADRVSKGDMDKGSK